MRVRLNLFPVVTKRSVPLTTKLKASNVTATVATRDNLAVSNTEFNAQFKSDPQKVKILLEFLQIQRVVPAGLKMVSHQVACTQLMQMAANQYKCYVTEPRTVEVGQFFSDVWTALLTSTVVGNPTKTGLEI